MNKYNAALIGTGRIGFTLGFDKKREQPASHSFALAKNKKISLVAACDTNMDNLNRWQKKFPKAVSFSTVDELLQYGKTLPQGNFDIITVAVNEDSHLECAIKAIQSKPRLVILEKPVALNSADAEKIRSAAKENEVAVMVNHERRFASDYKIAKYWLKNIGDLQCVNGRLFSGLRVYREEDETTGCYSLLHDGTHLVDIIMYLLESEKEKDENPDQENEIAKVDENAVEAGSEKAPVQKKNTLQKFLSALSGMFGEWKVTPQVQKEEKLALYNPKLISVFKDEDSSVRNISVNFMHENCPDVNVYISGRSKYFGFEVEVIGTEGKVVIGNGYAKVYQRKESKLYTGFYSLTRVKKVRFPKKTGYFANMVQNAVDYLDGNDELKSTLDNGIEAVKVLESIKALI